MISITAVLTRLPGLDAATLDLWIAQDWVRPRRQAGDPVFEEVDVARIRLIAELRGDLAINDEAIPVVLSLLDQLHATQGALMRLLRREEQS